METRKAGLFMKFGIEWNRRIEAEILDNRGTACLDDRVGEHDRLTAR